MYIFNRQFFFFFKCETCPGLSCLNHVIEQNHFWAQEMWCHGKNIKTRVTDVNSEGQKCRAEEKKNKQVTEWNQEITKTTKIFISTNP